MITTYTVPGWISWKTFQTQPAAALWTGHGTIEDPWIIAPADDIWGWFACETPARRYPHTVAMTLEYTQSHHALMTTVTVTSEPITPQAKIGVD